LLPPDAFPRLKICQQCVCEQGSAPDPTGRAYSVPPRPSKLVKGEGPPGWAPRKGDPREGEWGRKRMGGGGGRGKLLPSDVRFYG